jgi:phosphinothricin acetyltransferase
MIKVRPATPQDAAAIARIYNEAVLTTAATFDTQEKSEEDRRQWLAKHDERHPVWVAEIDHEIAGWASLSEWSDRCAYSDTAENSIYVASSHRGKGVGRELMKDLVDAARSVKIHTIIARIAGESEVSIRLHEQFGFTKIGTMKEVGKKFGRLHDVHLYQVML